MLLIHLTSFVPNTQKISDCTADDPRGPSAVDYNISDTAKHLKVWSLDSGIKSDNV